MTRSHMRRFVRLACWAVVGHALIACGDVPAAFGSDRIAARGNADELLGAFTARFTNVSRTPRYARARALLGHYALTPSAIYPDTSIWTVYGRDSTRTLFGEASVTNNHYVFTNVPTSTPLSTLGDGRHVMRLRKLSDNAYAWFTGVDFAAGHLRADDAANVINQWLLVTEGKAGNALRTDLQNNFPRSTRTFGKLFTIDTIVSVRDAAGGNTIYLGIQLTPDGIRPTLPHYAAYLDKYVRKVKLRFTLLDRQNRRWADAAMEHGYLTMRFRSHDGHFAPLAGPIAVIPDTLTIQLDATVKFGIFTVGVRKMTGEWVNIHSSHERGWGMRLTHEPDWVLPPTVGLLLRSPLRRPFMGDGTQFRITIRDDPGHQTLLSRRGTTTVQESAVLRFLGRLGGAAMGDFVETAEVEENQFDAAAFAALQGDFDAILGG